MAIMAPTARCFAVCKTPQDAQKKKPLDQRPKVRIDTMFVKKWPFPPLLNVADWKTSHMRQSTLAGWPCAAPRQANTLSTAGTKGLNFKKIRVI